MEERLRCRTGGDVAGFGFLASEDELPGLRQACTNDRGSDGEAGADEVETSPAGSHVGDS